MKRDVKTLTDRVYDVVVVGAGIYGAVTAWDAALRGLSVALIDRGDFGGKTSANSLKIVHGGLRYLQNLDFKRVRESVRERTILMRIAPHLVHPLPCVMPTYGHLMKGKEVMRAGLLMNDIVSFDRNRLDDPEKTIPRGRVVSKEACLRLLTGIDGRRVTGGAFWTDAQMFNSERLLLSSVVSAVNAGADAANYVEATGFLKKGGRIEGVKVRDAISGEMFDVRGRIVVNTSGDWVDKVLGLVNGESRRVRLSTAMNLVVDRRVLPECAAGVTGQFEFTRRDGSVHRGSRVLFMAPWRRFTLVGTYHRPYEGDPDGMRVTEEEIQAFLREINSAYPGDPIRREEVSFFHKGFLPMDGVNEKTGEVRLTPHYRIHDHGREDGLERLISVVGVKYTTVRDVAEKAVDLVVNKLGVKAPKCRTHETSLAGGAIERFDDFLARETKKKPEGLGDDVVRHLVYNYGSEYAKVLRYVGEDSKWGKMVAGSSEVLVAEVIHAVREEMAQRLTDVVFRRTDLGSGGNPGRPTLEVCASVMARELGWDRSRTQREVEEVEASYIPKSD